MDALITSPPSPVASPSAARASRDRGFTLVEMLTVVVILSILASIGVTVFVKQKSKSYLAGAVSDARNVGMELEDQLAKDGAYPSTMDRSASEVSDAKMSPGNQVAQYQTAGGGFVLCVIHVSGSTIDAWAQYSSLSGGLVGRGSTGSPSVCVMDSLPEPTTPDPSGGPTTPPPSGGPTTPPPSGGPTSGPTGGAPQNVRVTSVSGETKATIDWDDVSGGADTYLVYLDGDITAAWTGTAISAVLTGLSVGSHDVSVVATKNGTKSAKSDLVVFTIYGDNDYYAEAHPANLADGAAWTSSDYSNVNAQYVQPGEPNPMATGMWWTFTAPVTAAYNVKMIAPLSGAKPTENASIFAWKSTSTNAADLTDALAWNDQSAAGPSFAATQGDTIKIRVGTAWEARGQFRVKITRGATNDAYAQAAQIPASGSWTSPDADTTVTAGPESGEQSGPATGLWWTFTPTTTGPYNVETIAPLEGALPSERRVYAVWKSTAATVGDLPQDADRIVWNHNQWGPGPGPTFIAVAGSTYKIRVHNAWDARGQYRLKVTPGPVNDVYSEAAQVGSTASGSWTSPDADTTYTAPPELNEQSGPVNGLWWTFTPTTSGSYSVETIAPLVGALPTERRVYAVWKSTAATAGDLPQDADRIVWNHNAFGDGPGPTFNAVAGATYKIRVNAAWDKTGQYRLRVTQN